MGNQPNPIIQHERYKIVAASHKEDHRHNQVIFIDAHEDDFEVTLKNHPKKAYFRK